MTKEARSPNDRRRAGRVSFDQPGLIISILPSQLLAMLLIFLSAGMTRAEVVRVEVAHRGAFADGHAFGQSGAYEKITGRLHMAVDPSHPANLRVVDLGLVPRNDAGRVEFRTDFFLLVPADPLRGNRRLFYDVNNRGNKLALAAFNEQRTNDPSSLVDAGNGFLMRLGYAILWTGWNGDVEGGDGRMQIELPVARDPAGGGSVTGKVYSEICVDKKSFSEPLCPGNSNPYPAASLDHQSATLTMRPRRADPPTVVPPEQWAFARWENGQAVPDPTRLYLKEGFWPGWLYELVYEAKDPRVTGLGAVAVRDAVSFFRHASADAANPLAGAIERAYVFGISQSGRFIQHFIHEDFNADEQGRLVFDAAFSHVGAAATGVFNARFAQTTRHGSQHEDHLYPSDVFPFATVEQEDALTGRRGDMLGRARRAGHLPRLFLIETSTEYWGRGGSLLHTDVEGQRDLAIDPNVRLYVIAGAHHLFFTPPGPGPYQNEANSLNYRPLLRALLVALDRWVTLGEEPPPSACPRISDGTLVDFACWRESFPRIPGVRLPEPPYAPLRLDLGPRWESLGLADFVPPKVGPPFRTLVPAVDADGNELAGIRLPEVAVPLATYAGWNLRASVSGAEGMLTRWVGSRWPFPGSPAERAEKRDPRPSVLERYPTRERYLDALRQSVLELHRRRLLLEEDVQPILTAAATQPSESAWP